MDGFSRNALTSLTRGECAMLFSVPAVFRLILDWKVDVDAFSTVKYVMSAGSALPQQTRREWRKRFGHVIHEAYGQTESSPFAFYSGADTVERTGSIGRPIDGVEAAVLDEDGNHMPSNTVGEIGIKGPNVMVGYWNDVQATDNAVRGGWLHTGDFGYRDDGNVFFLAGRRTDLIICSGRNVYPAEVERVLLTHAAVVDANVYGVPHHIVGETVACDLVCLNSGAADASEIRKHCKQYLADYKVPIQITFVDNITRTETGKRPRSSDEVIGKGDRS